MKYTQGVLSVRRIKDRFSSIMLRKDQLKEEIVYIKIYAKSAISLESKFSVCTCTEMSLLKRKETLYIQARDRCGLAVRR